MYIKNVLFIVCFFTFGFNIYAQDWANLGRFRDDNEKLKTMQHEGRIVFMGNSITEGWGRIIPEYFQTESYVNRGISGQTTPQMLVRFRADVIDLKPKIVVILAGTNDLAGNTGPSSLEMIRDNIASMAQLASCNGIKVILCSVLPASDYSWSPGKEPAEKIYILNSMIRKYAKANNFYYVDFYSLLVNDQKGMRTEYSEDGVHPNKQGYAIMEPVIEKTIRKVSKHK